MLGVAASAATAQLQEPVREDVTVSLVEVTLHVTDKQGRVVPGLEEGGLSALRRRQARADRVGRMGRCRLRAPCPAARRRARSSALRRRSPRKLRPKPTGRLFVMVFQSHIEGQKDEGLMRMKRQALSFLDTLGPSDEVALLVFGSRLWLSQDFTSDKAVLRKAIHAAPRKEETARAANPEGAFDRRASLARGRAGRDVDGEGPRGDRPRAASPAGLEGDPLLRLRGGTLERALGVGVERRAWGTSFRRGISRRRRRHWRPRRLRSSRSTSARERTNSAPG